MNSNHQKKAELYRMVMEDHLCPYGLKSKDLLERKGFNVEDHHLKTREETDAFQEKHGVETTPQTWINGKRIGGYDELREYFGEEVKNDDGTSYKPVIAIFAVSFLMALAMSWETYETFLTIRAFEWFISIAMCLLAVEKLQDVESFSTMFLNYDLLARKWVRRLSLSFRRSAGRYTDDLGRARLVILTYSAVYWHCGGDFGTKGRIYRQA